MTEENIIETRYVIDIIAALYSRVIVEYFKGKLTQKSRSEVMVNNMSTCIGVVNMNRANERSCAHSDIEMISWNSPLYNS